MEFDSEYLLNLAHDKSAESRNRLSQVISDLFDNKEAILSEREKAMMFGIMHGLIRDVEVSMRKNFSLLLSTQLDAPAYLILELANDEIEVAYPVLTQSTVLRDEALVDIIQNRAQEHQLAISIRHDVSEDISDALVEHGDVDVITSLLNNENAKISETSIEYLVEQSKRYDTFQDPLLHRDELPEELAKKMFTWVSDALRTHIVSRYKIDDEVVNQLLKQSIDQEAAIREDSSANKMTNLASVLNDEHLISPNMVMAALIDGEVHLFLSLFSQLTNIMQTTCKHIIFDKNPESLAIACKAVGFNQMQFSILFQKTRKSSQGNLYEKENCSETALKLFCDISPEDASKALSNWQDTPGTSNTMEAHAI
ncbi:MAG: DUF2336 domain-containing protein [Rhodospirillales bacterium]|jgi:uncharacterized protein (DUF2336 family)|nr:DUF2336 domain-containing protein [Rhodospirillales bacterium]